MDEQEAQPFDAAGFKDMLMSKIKSILPKTEEEADEFKDSVKINQVKTSAQGQVEQEKSESAERINSDKRKEVIQAIETYATEILSERDNFLVSCTLSSLSIIKPTELKELMLHLLNVNRIDHEGISDDEIDMYLA